MGCFHNYDLIYWLCFPENGTCWGWWRFLFGHADLMFLMCNMWWVEWKRAGAMNLCDKYLDRLAQLVSSWSETWHVLVVSFCTLCCLVMERKRNVLIYCAGCVSELLLLCGQENIAIATLSLLCATLKAMWEALEGLKIIEEYSMVVLPTLKD